MYRPQRGYSGKAIVNLIIIGLVTGALFVLYDTFLRDDRSDPSEAVVPTLAVLATPVATPLSPPTVVPNGDPVIAEVTRSMVGVPETDATLFIPSVGVNAPIITAILRDSTWDVTQLGTNVGYLQGTSWLGSEGNIVLSGHVEMSDGRTGVFAALDEVQNGDLVVLTEAGQQYNYVVEDIRSVDPTDLSVVYPTDTEILTIITCSDYNFLQNTYDTRLVVRARRA